MEKPRKLVQTRISEDLEERLTALQSSWKLTQGEIVRRAIFEMPTREEMTEQNRLLARIAENVQRIAVAFDQLKAAKNWDEAKAQIDDPTFELMINFATTMASATSTLLRSGSAYDSTVGANIN